MLTKRHCLIQTNSGEKLFTNELYGFDSIATFNKKLKLRFPMCKNMLYLFLSLLASYYALSDYAFTQESGNTPKIYCELYHNFEPTVKKIIHTDSTIFYYNKEGEKTSSITYASNTTTQPALNTLFSYNSQNQIITETFFLWDTLTKNWSITPSKQATYFYSEIDSLSQIMYETYQNNSWSKYAKWEFSYNKNKRKSQELEFSWDTKTNAWSNKGCQKTTILYTNNLLSSKTHHQWNYKLDQFTPVSKTEFTYTKKGALETSTNLIWTEKETWKSNTKDSLLYDKNNQLKFQYGFNANNTLPNTWEIVYRIEHVVDTTNYNKKSVQTFWKSNKAEFLLDEYALETSYYFTKAGQLNSIINKHFDSTTKQFVTDSETYFITQPFNKTPQNNKDRS